MLVEFYCVCLTISCVRLGQSICPTNPSNAKLCYGLVLQFFCNVPFCNAETFCNVYRSVTVPFRDAVPYGDQWWASIHLNVTERYFHRSLFNKFIVLKFLAFFNDQNVSLR